MSPPHIKEILESDARFSAKSCLALEKYVDAQVADGTYDLEANLAILKLYLLHPEETKLSILQDVLLKALMAFPATDFSLCLFQIPEKQMEPVQNVFELAQQLEMAKFANFWKLAAEIDRLDAYGGWKDQVRKFIMGVITATFRSISKEDLKEFLNVDDAELEKLAKEQKWTESKENPNVFVVNTATFDTVKVQEPSEPRTLSMETYTKLFAAAAA
mmetsp:Transcript_14097/g.21282  ORF Transcript_14097/g.21282 Transcript_14097/m.21282 type:complete len:216 (-) Transcript_14097:114-761(-)|eukprot:CAMPEP_0194776842 /NCGR_PEP_ID=MMETSP0323_2-20130528/64152_1 /TAXON_ID=2866 ORGANISM="Crypthecodinium cohnii, Strain Seligo" /NCGR_SAMPLE_ID=MMETSP0323_2 /ASSEMBLY_ACC=CAM_ASM_000346 /LENGTH=215 /DNA_ID=CAMNT_0039713419 /DNA_START=71 /DNA_END=718 /DNA_ORIENTATION=-